LFFALISLPFIYVDVSVRSQEMLKPLQERTEFKSLTSGTIKEIFVKENQFVKQGNTLAN